MNLPNRPVIRQSFVPFSIAVAAAPIATPLAQQGVNSALSALYTAILLSVPTGGASVWLGDSSINAASNNGLEISPGVPVLLTIGNERQLYELQAPIVDALCIPQPLAIPFTVWDVSTIYLSSVAPQLVGCILFAEGFK